MRAIDVEMSAIPMLPPTLRMKLFMEEIWLFFSRGMPTYANTFCGTKTNASPNICSVRIKNAARKSIVRLKNVDMENIAADIDMNPNAITLRGAIRETIVPTNG